MLRLRPRPRAARLEGPLDAAGRASG
jgi:hypothetical protein